MAGVDRMAHWASRLCYHWENMEMWSGTEAEGDEEKGEGSV